MKKARITNVHPLLNYLKAYLKKHPPKSPRDEEAQYQLALKSVKLLQSMFSAPGAGEPCVGQTPDWMAEAKLAVRQCSR